MQKKSVGSVTTVRDFVILSIVLTVEHGALSVTDLREQNIMTVHMIWAFPIFMDKRSIRTK